MPLKVRFSLEVNLKSPFSCFVCGVTQKSPEGDSSGAANKGAESNKYCSLLRSYGIAVLYLYCLHPTSIYVS